MKIVLCTGTQFYSRLSEIQVALEQAGHEVLRPDGSEKKKTGALLVNLFPKIETADAVLACNWAKNGIAGYVGGNALIELGHAFYLNKKIFLLNPIPALPYAEEIRAMSPIIVGEDISGLK